MKYLAAPKREIQRSEVRFLMTTYIFSILRLTEEKQICLEFNSINSQFAAQFSFCYQKWKWKKRSYRLDCILASSTADFSCSFIILISAWEDEHGDSFTMEDARGTDVTSGGVTNNGVIVGTDK